MAGAMLLAISGACVTSTGGAGDGGGSESAGDGERLADSEAVGDGGRFATTDSSSPCKLFAYC